MLFARFEPHSVTSLNLLHRLAIALHPAKAGRDQNGLPQGVTMPRRTAPGSNVTVAQARAPLPLKGQSIRTMPVNQSDDPLAEGVEPGCLISMKRLFVRIEGGKKQSPIDF